MLKDYLQALSELPRLVWFNFRLHRGCHALTLSVTAGTTTLLKRREGYDHIAYHCRKVDEALTLILKSGLNSTVYN